MLLELFRELGPAPYLERSSRTKQRARLEARLRKFEHDAHLLARQDRPAPDIGPRRGQLGMEQRWSE